MSGLIWLFLQVGFRVSFSIIELLFIGLVDIRVCRLVVLRTGIIHFFLEILPADCTIEQHIDGGTLVHLPLSVISLSLQLVIVMSEVYQLTVSTLPS